MAVVALVSLQIYLSLSASPLVVLYHYQYQVQSTFARSSSCSRKSQSRSGRKICRKTFLAETQLVVSAYYPQINGVVERGHQAWWS